MLNTDHQGFILGELRLKQIRDGVENTHENTEKILEFLKAEMRRMSEAGQAQSDTLNKTLQDYIKQNKKAKDAASQSNGANTQNNAQPSPSTGTGRASSRPSRNADSNSKSNRPRPSRDAEDPNPNPTRRSRVHSQAEERAQQERERSNQDRDSKGRFTAKDKTILDKFKDFFKNGSSSGVNTDTKGYDPTIDALNELKDVVSPVGNIFGKMTSRAIGVFRGRMRKNRNEQTLPEEQQQANRREQESDKERNKLLKRLIDAVRANGGGGGGLFGGFFGNLFKGGKGLFKGLLKRIPLLGLLFGGASLFSEWGKLDSGGKGKGIGSLAGGALGAIFGSAFGPLGTIGGGMLGAYLGGIFGKKVGEWTDKLKDSDFVGIFKSLWTDAINKIVDIAEAIKNSEIVKDTKEKISNGIDYIKQGASNIAGNIKAGARNLYNKATGNSGGGSGVSGVDLLSYGQGGSGVVTTNGNGSKAVGIENAYFKNGKNMANTLRMDDGSIVTRTGARNWRNNNPGNIRPGAVSRKFGALGADNPNNKKDQFAIFPDYETGRKAKEYLIFESTDIARKLQTKADYGAGKGYRDKTLAQAITAYAPPEDKNDTARYIRNITNAVGSNKRMGDYTAAERKIIMDAMQKEEGWKVGTVTVDKKAVKQQSANQSPAVQPKGKEVIPIPQQTANVNNKSKMVTPKSSKDLADFAQNAEMPISSRVLNPNVTPKTKTILQMNRMQSSNITKVQPVAPERTPLSSTNKATPVMTAQAQDSSINQNVSDRGLAHIFSGGIGFKILQG
ncbi:hypothetical protein [Acinetobacter sp. CFCC 10889]|uniref:hypothetical protein n=1 Tax=Acinetobacter sp. CFCC 10889 TaxID=1775557 RepID=UPI000DD0B105|nr:hypothetical protein [Acinetobacter sp. CFCC 10889]